MLSYIGNLIIVSLFEKETEMKESGGYLAQTHHIYSGKPASLIVGLFDLPN